MNSRPQWQIPEGVTRGVWDYAHTDHIATDYDAYFAFHPLFDFDQAVAERYFQPGELIADLGCGTGRALFPLLRRGMRGLAVDLSEPMLEVVRAKAETEGLDLAMVRANLVELDGLANACVDHAICLFSTLGMIRGRENRRRALGHFRRIIKPGGVLVLHVHNFWHNLYDGGGPWWLMSNLWQAWLGGELEQGDKFFPYRGIPNMFLHVFTQGELTGDLAAAGFTLKELIPLDAQLGGELPHYWCFGSMRASGWVAVASA